MSAATREFRALVPRDQRRAVIQFLRQGVPLVFAILLARSAEIAVAMSEERG
ncbi:MAG: hypothetical protein GYB50_04095 [Rhodobacteraceae bacterium]|nr:hypothetical protein [Paracoccaceae bacterium]